MNLIKKRINNFKNNEIGGAEIVSIVLIIIVVVGLAVIFKDKLTSLLNGWFETISNDSKAL